jgi:hypothetical protein
LNTIGGVGNEVERLLDEPLKVEINLPEMVGYNSNFRSLSIFMRFPRQMLFNYSNSTFEVMDWQRVDASVVLGLPRVTVVTVLKGKYERQPVPSTTFTPQGGPATAFVPADFPETPFVRRELPETGYTPCDPTAGTDYTHRAEATTPFTHQPIPDVEYVECGTRSPDKFILLGPWMPKRISEN